MKKGGCEKIGEDFKTKSLIEEKRVENNRRQFARSLSSRVDLEQPKSSTYGQILSETVINSGSGSALSAGLKIRKDRAAPHDNDITDVMSEKIWVPFSLPVLRTMAT